MTPRNQTFTLKSDNCIEARHWEYYSPGYATWHAMRQVYRTGNQVKAVHNPRSRLLSSGSCHDSRRWEPDPIH